MRRTRGVGHNAGMAHENSRTVLRDTPQGPRFFVIDASGEGAGEVLLGGKMGFATRAEANRAAAKRSKSMKPRRLGGSPLKLGNPLRRALEDG